MDRESYIRNRYSKVDQDSINQELGLKEFSAYKDIAFEKHLKRLHKYSQLAKDKFHCDKFGEFFSYVMSNEGYWHNPQVKLEDIH